MQHTDYEAIRTASSMGSPVMLGLERDDWGRALASGSATRIGAISAEQCLIVPINHNSWINLNYWEGQKPSFVHLLDNGMMPDSSYDELCEEMRSSGRTHVLECAIDGSDQRLERIIQASARLGATFTQTRTVNPAHYFYLEQFRLISDAAAKPSGSLFTDKYPGYDKGNAILKHHLSDTELEEAWSAYQAAFTTVSDNDPFRTTLDYADFKELMQDAQYLKYVYTDTGGIASLMTICRVQDCPWLNQDYKQAAKLAEDAGEEYMTCPLVFTRPGTKPLGGVYTMTEFAKSLHAFRMRPVILIECNDISNQYIPRLATFATRKSGLLELRLEAPTYTQELVEFRLG